jgi:hypothetical protein
MADSGACWVEFAVVWCDRCDGDRPHHGPFCCSCGASTEEEPEPGGRPDWVGSTEQRPVPPWEPNP